jgi:hypothetical protein
VRARPPRVCACPATASPLALCGCGGGDGVWGFVKSWLSGDLALVSAARRAADGSGAELGGAGGLRRRGSLVERRGRSKGSS